MPLDCTDCKCDACAGIEEYDEEYEEEQRFLKARHLDDDEIWSLATNPPENYLRAIKEGASESLEGEALTALTFDAEALRSYRRSADIAKEGETAAEAVRRIREEIAKFG